MKYLFVIVICCIVVRTNCFYYSDSEVETSCLNDCTLKVQNRTDKGHYGYVCDHKCNIEHCLKGCKLWKNALTSTCRETCNATTERPNPKELYCVIGCNDAVTKYLSNLRVLLGTPPAPALLADSLKSDSLKLEWNFPDGKKSGLSCLLQWQYEEFSASKSTWQYCRNTTWDAESNVFFVQDLQPYTKYRVWVMGEHEDDNTIEDILRKEATEQARILAEKETEQLREEVRKGVKAKLLEDFVDLAPKIEEDLPKLRIEDDMDIYCSVEEIQAKIHSKPQRNANNYSLNYYPSRNKKFNDAPEIINSQKVTQRVALWEQKLLKDKTTEIFQKIQKKHQQVVKEAEEEERRKEQVWREQERKAKQAEQQIREIARRAREEHKQNSSFHIDTSFNANNSGTPSGKQVVLEWYKNAERQRLAGLDSSNNVMPWFHGLITRQEAEKLLLDQPYGTFLVRLSERIWGYAISYRAHEKCKHYLVNAVPKYSFVGNNSSEYDTLGEMITFHQAYPLSGGETLQYPCPKISMTATEELFVD